MEIYGVMPAGRPVDATVFRALGSGDEEVAGRVMVCRGEAVFISIIYLLAAPIQILVKST